MEAPEGRKPEGVGVNPHIRGSSPERPKKVGGRCSADSRHATSEPPHFNKGSYAVRPRTAGWIRAEPRAANPWIMASREQHARVSSQPSHFLSKHAACMPRPRSLSCSCSPTAETRRRERRQCGCESCHEHHFQNSGIRSFTTTKLPGKRGCR